VLGREPSILRLTYYAHREAMELAERAAGIGAADRARLLGGVRWRLRPEDRRPYRAWATVDACGNPSIIQELLIYRKGAMDASRKYAAEFIGTGFLLATVVGSGIMAERLAGGNVAVALLGNTIPTGAILVVLITMLGPISGAHFNPAVTFAFWLRREIAARESLIYIAVQIAGGLAGVWAAHDVRRRRYSRRRRRCAPAGRNGSPNSSPHSASSSPFSRR
jgi:hypothetical protein